MLARSIALLLTATLAAPVSADIAPRFSPLATSPEGALHALARAYDSKSIESLAGLYSADFEFHTTAPEVADAMPKRIDRATELRFSGNLFNGMWMNGTLVRPAAETVEVQVGDLREAPDPEHPDSVAQYRLVSVGDFRFRMTLASGDTLAQNPSLHVFQVVRGDAALRVAGQSPDTTRWYIRRWLENVNGLALNLARAQGDCGPEPVNRARSEERLPAAPLALKIHPLGNPACSTVDILCDLPDTSPAQVEMFDIAGRRVNRQTVTVRAAGVQRLQAGAGADIRPGVYFLRLTQGRRQTSSMVVVAK